MKKMGNVKMKDIAEALDVSTVTVSNALAGRKGVSEEVRTRVVEKAKELGVTPMATWIGGDEKKYEQKSGIYHRRDSCRKIPGTWSILLLEHVSESCICSIKKSKCDNA